MAWSYGFEPLLSRPVANGEPDRVAHVGRQQALLDADHLVPAPGAMKAELDAVVAGRERVLELVAVAVDRHRGHDRLERRIGDPPDAYERIAHLLRLLRELHLVREVLEPAATAGSEMPARCLDAVGTRLEKGAREPFSEPALDLRYPRANAIARQPASHEDDEPVVTRDAVAAVRERLDRELELLSFVNRRGHGRPA